MSLWFCGLWREFCDSLSGILPQDVRIHTDTWGKERRDLGCGRLAEIMISLYLARQLSGTRKCLLILIVWQYLNDREDG